MWNSGKIPERIQRSGIFLIQCTQNILLTSHSLSAPILFFIMYP